MEMRVDAFGLGLCGLGVWDLSVRSLELPKFLSVTGYGVIWATKFLYGNLIWHFSKFLKNLSRQSYGVKKNFDQFLSGLGNGLLRELSGVLRLPTRLTSLHLCLVRCFDAKRRERGCRNFKLSRALRADKISSIVLSNWLIVTLESTDILGRVCLRKLW